MGKRKMDDKAKLDNDNVEEFSGKYAEYENDEVEKSVDEYEEDRGCRGSHPVSWAAFE